MEELNSDHAYKRKTRRLLQNTIKFNCPATLKIQRIVRFPDFKLDTENSSKRVKSAKLKELNDTEGPLRCQEVYQLTIPLIESHMNHVVGKKAGMLQHIDEGVKAHIHLMVSQGVNFLSEMQPHLRQYLNLRFDGTSLPDKSNRRFWPTDKEITNHTQSAFSLTLPELVWVSGAIMVHVEKIYPRSLDRFLFSVRTNNGIERTNRFFKQNSLHYKTNNSLCRTLHILVTDTAPRFFRRYQVANDMCSGLRRRYSDAVPVYIRDRPKKMVQQCETRRIEGELMVSSVSEVKDETYIVKSQPGMDSYRVSLKEPSCACIDYQKHLYPCKHIYAVLYKDGKIFMDLSEQYVQSPWYKLDHEVMTLRPSIPQPDDGECEMETDFEAGELDCARSELAHAGLDPLPKKVRVQLTVASDCRELLWELTSLSYKVTDNDLLRDLNTSLRHSITTLNSDCECGEDGLQKEPGTKVSGHYRKKATRAVVGSLVPGKWTRAVENITATCSVLPRRQGPSKLTGRVGVSADQRRPKTKLL